MTNKESKIQELINLAKNDTPLAPPCCEGCVLDLFNSYFHLWLPQCSNSDTFVDDIIKKYPSHSKTDIVRLKEYLSAAHKYLMDICDYSASRYKLLYKGHYRFFHEALSSTDTISGIKPVKIVVYCGPIYSKIICKIISPGNLGIIAFYISAPLSYV